jgi:putative glycosyltransferase (TIGR04372 family)
MGKAVKDEFRVQHPRIVDYSTSKHRSDFLDIWLMANCYFCISTGAGLDEVAGMMGKPGVFVNFLPLTHIPLYKQSITVPKKLVWSETGQLLSLVEYIQNGYTSTEEYKENGITINSLTPTEIKQVVVEMLETMGDKRDIREEQTKRHEQLIQIILKYDKFNKRKYQFYRHPDARLGMGFLEANWDQLSR